MLYSRALKMPCLAVAAVICLLSLPGFAREGRDFAGFYSVTQQEEQGDLITITLRVQLFNYSEADISRATVSLHSMLPSSDSYGSFRTVKLWRDKGEVRLMHQFTLPRWEYERWQQNSQPQLFVTYRDDAGTQFERFVQLGSRSVIP